ncbi:dihydrodipicolinate synthase [Mucor ambiguus]|uniref:Dihydrodipicolinate synthase n=1 Tax=Mucor ambiguus TaxID=91626 RepID=A0A0C9M1J2_9FUNG|nr:dihydrodipicolinate synthase [Mucor ambiguus]
MLQQQQQFIFYSIAMVTPFTKEGDLCLESIPELVKFYMNKLEAPGLLISGSTGEQHCMTIAERKQLYKIVGETVPKDFPLYAGVAAFKTKDAIELAQAAGKSGFAGIMLGVPPYRLPSQRELKQYVIDVAKSTKLPIFLYNNPDSNGVQIEPETYASIASIAANVYGLKEVGNTANVKRVKQLLGNKAGQHTFFTGIDEEYAEAYTEQGYTGITSVAGNVFPREMKQAVEYLHTDQTEEGKKLMSSLVPKIRVVLNAGFLQSIKYILRKRGAPAGYCPPPLLEPTDEDKARLDAYV